MKELTPISYCLDEELPSWWDQAISSSSVQRLKAVGMNCGLEYTKFGKFAGICDYSRFVHSLGVAKIVWRFSHDAKQTLSALYHDISTPCFAHVVDFLNGDYIGQESTEDKTGAVIEGDPQIQSLLLGLGLSTADVDDYHCYPIADTPSPSLSADRIEYTFSNSLNLLGESMEKMEGIYSHLFLDREGHLEFDDFDSALEFGRCSLRCGAIYCCDEDRYSMEVLARLLSRALDNGIIENEDLMGREDALIDKLVSSSMRSDWLKYRQMSSLQIDKDQPSEKWLKVDAKKRYIDPKVNGSPLTQLSQEYSYEVERFLALRFDYYMKASNQ